MHCFSISVIHFQCVFSCCHLRKEYKQHHCLKNFSESYIPESISEISWLLYRSCMYSTSLVLQIIHLIKKLFHLVNYNGLRVLQIEWIGFSQRYWRIQNTSFEVTVSLFSWNENVVLLSGSMGILACLISLTANTFWEWFVCHWDRRFEELHESKHYSEILY